MVLYDADTMEPASHIDSQSSTLRRDIAGSSSQVGLFVSTLSGQTTRTVKYEKDESTSYLRFEFPDLCIRVPGKFRFACHIFNRQLYC